MRLRSILAACAFLPVLVPFGMARAQSPGEVLFTSTGYVQINATVTDTDGSRYVAGAYSGTLFVQGDPHMTSTADTDGFVARLSASGDVEWLFLFMGARGLPPGFSADGATSLALDGQGGVYVGGGFTDSLFVQTSRENGQWISEPTGSGRASLGAFLVHYAPQGYAEFVLGGSGGERPAGTSLAKGGADGVLSLASDGTGGVVVGGTVSGGGSFLGISHAVLPDSVPTFVATRISGSGVPVWTRFGASARSSSARGVAVGGTRAYVLGPYEGALAIGDGFDVPDGGGFDTFIAALDLASGAVEWVGYLGGAGDVTANGVASDDAGALYMTGAFEGSLSDDEGDDSPGYVDGYLAKYDAEGEFAWIQVFGGLDETTETYAEGMGVSTGPDGQVLVSGRYNDDIAFYLDPRQATLASGTDELSAFSAVFSPGGSYLWSKRVGQEGQQIGFGFETLATDGVLDTPLFPVQAILEPGNRVRQTATFATLASDGETITGIGITETVSDLPEVAAYGTLTTDTDYAIHDGTGASRINFQVLGTAQSVAFSVEPGAMPELLPPDATPVARRYFLAAEAPDAFMAEDFEATVTLCYLDSEVGTLDESTLSLYRYNVFAEAWEAVTSTPDPAANCVTATGVTLFSPWAIGPVGEGGLPVELTAFSAVRDGAAVRLAWTTESETRNAGFGIEVGEAAASGAVAWRDVAFVPGAGTTSERRVYGHTLQSEIAARATRVRLRQMDIDGTAPYSAAVEIAAGVEFALGHPSPNPARAGATVRFTLPRAMHVRLVAYDVLGRAVATIVEGELDAGAHTAQLGSDLAAGTYVLRLEGRGLARSQPLTVLR